MDARFALTSSFSALCAVHFINHETKHRIHYLPLSRLPTYTKICRKVFACALKPGTVSKSGHFRRLFLSGPCRNPDPPTTKIESRKTAKVRDRDAVCFRRFQGRSPCDVSVKCAWPGNLKNSRKILAKEGSRGRDCWLLAEEALAAGFRKRC